MKDPYSTKVRELFEAPQHVGDVQGGIVARASGADAAVRLSARARDGAIEVCRFRARGCPHLIAAAEAVCRALEGRKPVELEEFSASQIRERLAVPLEKTGRILVLEDAVRELGHRLGGAS